MYRANILGHGLWNFDELHWSQVLVQVWFEQCWAEEGEQQEGQPASTGC